MTDKMIQEIDRKPVRYLLWSNRIFPEFGTTVFGKDFDPEIGDYLKANYHRVGPLLPPHRLLLGLERRRVGSATSQLNRINSRQSLSEGNGSPVGVESSDRNAAEFLHHSIVCLMPDGRS